MLNGHSDMAGNQHCLVQIRLPPDNCVQLHSKHLLHGIVLLRSHRHRHRNVPIRPLQYHFLFRLNTPLTDALANNNPEDTASLKCIHRHGWCRKIYLHPFCLRCEECMSLAKTTTPAWQGGGGRQGERMGGSEVVDCVWMMCD